MQTSSLCNLIFPLLFQVELSLENFLKLQKCLYVSPEDRQLSCIPINIVINVMTN
jgi:hypothetical protein